MNLVLRMLPLAFVMVLLLIPMWRIVGRTGLSAAWSLLVLIPFLGYPALVVMLALSPWPRRLGGATPGREEGGTAFALPPLLVVGLWGLLIISLLASGRVINRAGFSPWWALVLVVPLLNVILIWAFAFARWPAQEALPSQGADGAM